MSDDNDKDDPFPLWNEPARKADVIRAIVYTQAAMSKIGAALVALRTGDDETAKKRIDEYAEANTKLSEILDSISGYVKK